jgi:hypothetical protein
LDERRGTRAQGDRGEDRVVIVVALPQHSDVRDSSGRRVEGFPTEWSVKPLDRAKSGAATGSTISNTATVCSPTTDPAPGVTVLSEAPVSLPAPQLG